ncbi:hypothetical protein CBS147332_1489 [Penicillium roqueforti]|nr:hypothetical protein CBS147332_1489 [Penicillium roqueforti]KAI3123050.1 hypothetical protein CBS147331_1500 [Penicillium roqueforti]
MTFSPDDRVLASGSLDKIVRLWHPATGALTQTLEGHLGSVVAVAFSSDGRLLASSSDDKTLDGHPKWVLSVTFSPDNRLLASGTGDHIVRLWDLATGALTQTLEGHLGSVVAVAFSPKGQLLASGSSDKTVRLWDLATGALIQTLKGHSFPVESVAFSPNGQLLASGSCDKTVRLWDLETGVLIRYRDSRPSPEDLSRKCALEDHSGRYHPVCVYPKLDYQATRCLKEARRQVVCLAGRVQNSGITGQWAVKGRLDVQSYGVERQPFLASKAVIFGVNPTDPHILVVKAKNMDSHSDAAQALGYMGCIHQERKSLHKQDCTIYGLVTTGELSASLRFQMTPRPFGLLVHIFCRAAVMSPAHSKESSCQSHQQEASADSAHLETVDEDDKIEDWYD